MKSKILNLGFLASHNGSGMKAVVAAIHAGQLSANPKVAISNNAGSGALEFASGTGIAALHVSRTNLGNGKSLDAELLRILMAHNVDVIVLSGYLRKLGPKILSQFNRRILNVHPTLLPKFGGKGMHGRAAHQAVIASGEIESGATVHLVDAEYDCGEIICQETVPVLANDTPETLAARVAKIEGELLVEALKMISNRSFC